MTRREKVLATTLIAMMAVMGGGVLLHMFVWQPFVEVSEALDREKKELTEKQNDLSKEERTIEGILRVNPRLSLWKQISLPPRDPADKPKPGVSLAEQKKKHISQLQVDYVTYLGDLLAKNGFQNDSILIRARQPDRRSGTGMKTKEPVYERLAFAVSATGSGKAVVDTLREFYGTPLLHEVRGVTLTLAQPRSGRQTTAGMLDMNLTVEALIVNKAEERSALLPSKLPYQPRVLAEPGRSYDLMVKRNMFTGIQPSPSPPAKRDDKVPASEKREILRFVKLTMLFFNPDRRRWEATLYDQAKGGAEMKLNERILNEISINDKSSNPVLEAKVVKIDEEQLIFKTEGKFYRLRCGDFIYPAIRDPMKNSELRELGIKPES